MHCLVYRWISSGSWLHSAMPFLPVFQRDCTPAIIARGLYFVESVSSRIIKRNLQKGMAYLNDFSIGLFGQVMHPPLDVSTIALFVAYLHNLHLSYQTINTYLSALAYVHKILRLPNPTSQFLITRLIRGSQSLKPSYDLHLPITIHILDKLVASLQHVSQSYFHQHLFAAIFFVCLNTLTSMVYY